MPYPQPPWTLKGYAIQTLQLLDIERVRPSIPKELNIVSVLPGKTLGGVYLSLYGSGSVLEYSELIVIAGIAQYGAKFGPWISHIYVDNPDSVAGGREIWGLPKELAEFTWQNNHCVTVRQGDRLLCSLDSDRQGFGWRQSLAATSFSAMNSDLLIFPAEVESNLNFISSKLEVLSSSPFSELDLGQPFLTVRCDNMTLRVGAPQVIGQRRSEFSYQ